MQHFNDSNTSIPSHFNILKLGCNLRSLGSRGHWARMRRNGRGRSDVVVISGAVCVVGTTLSLTAF